MLVIPAIDIKNGRCVRLKQGRMSEETLYSEVPEEEALRWYHEGAERIHIVDLDGAIKGRPVNESVIQRIVRSVPIPIELGGGIRDMEIIDAYLDLGVRFVILGTVAYKDPGFVHQACGKYPGRIILGIDASQGHVAVEGWTEKTDVSPLEMIKSFGDVDISAVIYTDIERDGMRTGPNIEATKNLSMNIKIPVIASGGVSEMADIKRLMAIEKYGVMGVITGRAIYEGTLILSEAIKLSKSR
ncbi:MAG: 1-(5-phosphoribosyl)-5-[(5-phosphoribosylamino)methylideneamino]imidazole-4-carboxamide isomerase [Deltaproteobacteria bacterium]|nr:1-(5-phosphoribosyl)-5-[(5-phosphoribosylamino)methylideneamino]imidazole-4-carboxamide isomerase [Deltaproteobacteria bacterium]